MKYAGFWRRFSAYTVDWLILQVLAGVLVYASHAYAQGSTEQWKSLLEGAQQIQQQQGQSGGAFGGPVSGLSLSSLLDPMDIFLTLVLAAFYNIFFVASCWQATPGKRWYKLKVVTVTGEPLSLGHSAARHLACAISTLPAGFGFVMVAFTPEKTALHDIMCNTRVIYREASHV